MEEYKPELMPDSLRQYLSSLSKEEANKVWMYLDGCDVYEMIDIVAPLAGVDKISVEQWSELS